MQLSLRPPRLKNRECGQPASPRPLRLTSPGVRAFAGRMLIPALILLACAQIRIIAAPPTHMFRTLTLLLTLVSLGFSAQQKDRIHFDKYGRATSPAAA